MMGKIWYWGEPITAEALVEHIDMLPTLTPSELKDELKQRGQPVSGTKLNLQTRLLIFDISNMKYPEIMPQKVRERFVKRAKETGPESNEYTAKILIPKLRELLVTLSNSMLVLNWTSFPEVLLDE